MGSMPAYMPTSVCFDCSVYFWFGIGIGLAFAVVLALLAHHIFK